MVNITQEFNNMGDTYSPPKLPTLPVKEVELKDGKLLKIYKQEAKRPENTDNIFLVAEYPDLEINYKISSRATFEYLNRGIIDTEPKVLSINFNDYYIFKVYMMYKHPRYLTLNTEDANIKEYNSKGYIFVYKGITRGTKDPKTKGYVFRDKCKTAVNNFITRWNKYLKQNTYKASINSITTCTNCGARHYSIDRWCVNIEGLDNMLKMFKSEML